MRRNVNKSTDFMEKKIEIRTNINYITGHSLDFVKILDIYTRSFKLDIFKAQTNVRYINVQDIF